MSTRPLALIVTQLIIHQAEESPIDVEPDYEVEYSRRIERHAKAVVDAALAEGWLTYLPEDGDQTPLQRAVNELARNLRYKHFDGDGCLNHGE